MAPPNRKERVTWVDPDGARTTSTTSTSKSYGSFPAAQDATSSSSSNAERGPLLPSHRQHHQQQEEQEEVVAGAAAAWPSATQNQRQQERRLRWRAIAVSVSSILGVACLLLVVVVRGSNGGIAGQGPSSSGGGSGSEITAAISNAEGTGAGVVTDPLPPLPGESFLGSEGEGSAFGALRLGFHPGMIGAARQREGAPGPDGGKAKAPADPSPGYPSTAPQDPSIKIPVTMGCLEAMCEQWMAAMGKAFKDKANLVLLDCIQRTGMSANDTRACFARADVAGSPTRSGLYQCAVCRECLPAKDAKEQKALCKDYQASSSSAGAGDGKGGGGAKAAPSASEWRQYVPKKYVPSMLRTPNQWF